MQSITRRDRGWVECGPLLINKATMPRRLVDADCGLLSIWQVRRGSAARSPKFGQTASHLGLASRSSLLPIHTLADRLTPAFNATMDPITAVGLASSIITFVEFGFKLVDGAREIHLSTTGKTAHNATAEVVVTEFKLWSARLATPV